MVDAIITWAIKTKSKLTKNSFERISAQIENEFCQDKVIKYTKFCTNFFLTRFVYILRKYIFVKWVRDHPEDFLINITTQ